MSKIDFSARHGRLFGPVLFQPANIFEPYARTNGRHPPWSPPHKFPQESRWKQEEAKKKEEALPPVSLSICSVDGAVAFQDCLRIWISFLFVALPVPSKRLEIVEEISSEMMNGAVNGATMKNSLEKPFKIFIGYDPREDLAYEVCRYSILKRSSIPVDIIPIKQSELRKNGLYWRERGKLESTEFSFSRFLTPHLANYDGWAMFVDCDFLYLGDIKELRGLADDKYAVMCVQHDYTPKETTKMDGAVQTVYPRKNWSSMVLYNCGHPKNKVLTPEVVNAQTGAYLHRFQWLDDSEIGSIPFVWNFLVGHNKVVENDPSTFPKAIHYTLGGPWFEAWKNCEFGDLWTKESEEYQKQDKSKVE